MSLSKDLADYAKAITDDKEHGASHLLKVAAGSLNTALLKNPKTDPLEVRAAAKEYAVRMIHGQRQMASVLNFCNNLLLTIEATKDDASLLKELKNYSLGISKNSSEALAKISTHANESVIGSVFMTHSRSSTLLAFLTGIKKRKDFLVFVTTSRPGSEGKLLAGELSVAGVRSVLIEESEAMAHMGAVSALLVGADAIIPSGVINKVGTHMLALAARERGIPVYCMTERIKIWPFDEPIVSNLNIDASKTHVGETLYELTPGSLFELIILETGPTTFEKISLERKEMDIVPEIRKLVKV